MPRLGIDGPTLRIGAGSTLYGTVTLYGNKGTDLQSTTVRMVGKCLTRITAHNNSGCSNLSPIGVEGEAIYGPDVLHHGHSLPFAFILPAQCNKISGNMLLSLDNSGFDCEPYESLPTPVISARDSGMYIILYGFGAPLTPRRSHSYRSKI